MSAWWYLVLGLGVVAAVALHLAALRLRNERTAVEETVVLTASVADSIARGRRPGASLRARTAARRPPPDTVGL